MAVPKVTYWGKELATQDPRKAIKILKELGFVVMFCGGDIDNINELIDRVVKILQLENEKKDDVYEQIIIQKSEPFDAIDGCESVYAVKILGKTLKSTNERKAIFEKWDFNVLALPRNRTIVVNYEERRFEIVHKKNCVPLVQRNFAKKLIKY